MQGIGNLEPGTAPPRAEELDRENAMLPAVTALPFASALLSRWMAITRPSWKQFFRVVASNLGDGLVDPVTQARFDFAQKEVFIGRGHMDWRSGGF